MSMLCSFISFVSLFVSIGSEKPHQGSAQLSSLFIYLFCFSCVRKVYEDVYDIIMLVRISDVNSLLIVFTNRSFSLQIAMSRNSPLKRPNVNEDFFVLLADLSLNSILYCCDRSVSNKSFPLD